MKLLFSFLLAFTFTAHANDLIDTYSKLELRALPESIDRGNYDIGFFMEFTPYKIYGVYGIKHEGGEAELIEKLILSSSSFGLQGNSTYSNDNVISISEIEGLSLNKLCSRFHGVSSGFALIAGGQAFAAINKSGVVLKSKVTVKGVIKLNVVSYKTVKITCLNPENENWNKVVRF